VVFRISGLGFPSDFGFRISDFPRRAFTLLEVLLAVSIFAIVLVAINTVFYSALRLRQRTAETLSESLPVQQALAILRRDLRGTLPPVGVLASSFKDGLVGSGTVQSSGLEFFTTTGILTDDAPWGDVQKVTYQLTDSLDRSRARGKDLVRSVTRNLLTTALEEPEEQRLAGNVESLEFWCFNGTDWRNTWDTTMGDTNLPVAVKVRLLLATDNPGDILNRQPLEMLVPLTIQARTNQVASTGGGQ
jgi:general secretion pathway protein J